MKLNTENIPKEFQYLKEYAEEWGITDDGYRAEKIENANKEELQELVNLLRNLDDDNMDAWLAGDESYSENPSAEYIAYSCLMIAMQRAGIELSKRTAKQ